MTATELARSLHARRIGKGKWLARCPVHDERTASLSIRDMGDRMSLRCFGCGAGARQVLAALGMAAGEMYYTHGTRPDPEILRQIADQEERYLRDQRQQKDIAYLALKRAYDWDTASHELARLLIVYPHDDRLAVLYHRCLDYMRRCERIAEAHYPPKLWGTGIVPGTKRKWPTELWPSDVGSEIAGRLGGWA